MDGHLASEHGTHSNDTSFYNNTAYKTECDLPYKSPSVVYKPLMKTTVLLSKYLAISFVLSSSLSIDR